MLRKILFVCALLLPINLLAANGSLSSSQLGELSDKNAQIKAKIRELDEVGSRLVSAKARQRSAADSIDRLEEDSDAALAKLDRLQQIDREDPDAVAPEKIAAAKDANRKAKAALKAAAENRDAAADELKSLNNSANEKYEEFKRLEDSFERDVDTAVNTQVDKQIRAMQASKEVTGFGRVSCGDDSPRVCKERALKAAEQDASEKGSIVFVNSFTEIKNFKLSKEEVRSEVSATLSNKEVLSQKMIGEAEGWEASIKAKVDPVIGDALRDQMAEGTRAEIYSSAGGKVDPSQVRNPVTADESSYTKPTKEKERKVTEGDSRAARKAAREEEARRKAEEARAAVAARLEAQAAEERRRALEERIRAAEERRRIEDERRRAAEEKRRSSVPTFSF
ncbi:MAG: hypothetical protein WCI39_01180 [Gallionellaceae bacterium]